MSEQAHEYQYTRIVRSRYRCPKHGLLSSNMELHWRAGDTLTLFCPFCVRDLIMRHLPPLSKEEGQI